MKRIIAKCLLSALLFNCAMHAMADNIKTTNFNYKHFGIIVSGPSGVGKTTIVEKLLTKHPELRFSISTTTRMPRKGEVDGVSYYFLDRLKFEELVQKDEFMEYAENYGNYYGSPKRNYIEAMNNNQDIVFVLSTEGMENAIKNKKMDFVTIFINVDPEEKIVRRLKSRSTDGGDQLKKRLSNIKHEQSQMKKYDYVVYNENIDFTIKTIEAIYLAEKAKRMTNEK